jgi:hypothetical protein
MPLDDRVSQQPGAFSSNRYSAESTGYSSAKSQYLDPSLAGARVSNIRDREDRSLPFSRVVEGQGLTADQESKLQVVYEKAREIQSGTSHDGRLGGLGRDRGQDLRDLVPILLKDPPLLDKLHEVATATTLFSVEKAAGVTPDGKKESKEELERRRSDFLVDLIQNTAHPERITQGPGAMCTAATMAAAMDRGAFLRLACDYAAHGRAVTPSGKEMVALPEYHQRSIENSAATLSSIRSVRPSAGWLNVLDGVIALGVPREAQQTGAFWWQYTDAWRHLTGREQMCYGSDAHVSVSASGEIARNEGEAIRKIAVSDFVISQLSERPNKGIPIDTAWSHEGAFQGASGEHGRHMLLAKRIEERVGENGTIERFVVCQNPIGKFVHQQSGTFFKEGAVLGSKNDFWFTVGKGTEVAIREDVFRNHLRTVVLDDGKSFAYNPDNVLPPRGVGTLDTEEVVFVSVPDGVYESGTTSRESGMRTTKQYAAPSSDLAMKTAAPQPSSEGRVAATKATRRSSGRGSGSPREGEGDAAWWEGGTEASQTTYSETRSGSQQPHQSAFHTQTTTAESTHTESAPEESVPKQPLPRPSYFSIPGSTTGPEGYRLTTSATLWGSKKGGNFG